MSGPSKPGRSRYRKMKGGYDFFVLHSVYLPSITRTMADFISKIETWYSLHSADIDKEKIGVVGE